MLHWQRHQPQPPRRAETTDTLASASLRPPHQDVVVECRPATQPSSSLLRRYRNPTYDACRFSGVDGSNQRLLIQSEIWPHPPKMRSCERCACACGAPTPERSLELLQGTKCVPCAFCVYVYPNPSPVELLARARSIQARHHKLGKTRLAGVSLDKRPVSQTTHCRDQCAFAGSMSRLGPAPRDS